MSDLAGAHFAASGVYLRLGCSSYQLRLREAVGCRIFTIPATLRRWYSRCSDVLPACVRSLSVCTHCNVHWTKTSLPTSLSPTTLPSSTLHTRFCFDDTLQLAIYKPTMCNRGRSSDVGCCWFGSLISFLLLHCTAHSSLFTVKVNRVGYFFRFASHYSSSRRRNPSRGFFFVDIQNNTRNAHRCAH